MIALPDKGPWKRIEKIGDAVLILGDCLEVLPYIHAVITDDIMGHEKSTGRERGKKRTGGGALGIEASGNRSPLPSGRPITDGCSESLRYNASGDVQGVEKTRHKGEVTRAQGRGERSLHSRHVEHSIPQDGEEESLRDVRSDGKSLCASQERKSSRQSQGQPSSSLLAMSQQAPQKQVLEKAQGFAIVTDPPYGIGFEYGDAYVDRGGDEYLRLVSMLKGYPLALLQYPEEMMRYCVPVLGAPDDCFVWCYNSLNNRQSRIWGFWGIKPDWSQVKQPPKNPLDSRITGEQVNGGVRSYDWCADLQQVKNVSEEKTAHPCQIPVGLVNRIIRFTSAQSVVDPFLGSGTTGVACAQLGRSFVGIEIEPKYFDIACERITNAYRQKPMFDSYDEVTRSYEQVKLL